MSTTHDMVLGKFYSSTHSESALIMIHILHGALLKHMFSVLTCNSVLVFKMSRQCTSQIIFLYSALVSE